MIKAALKEAYFGGTTPTALQNEFSTYQQNYYGRETRVMFNHLINDFYTRFLFKIDVIPQDVAFPLYISATFFNYLIPDCREFLISEGIQITPPPPIETNRQGNQSLILVINATVEEENNIITIKAAVHPAVVNLNHKKYMSMPGGGGSIKMYI